MNEVLELCHFKWKGSDKVLYFGVIILVVILLIRFRKTKIKFKTFLKRVFQLVGVSLVFIVIVGSKEVVKPIQLLNFYSIIKICLFILM